MRLLFKSSKTLVFLMVYFTLGIALANTTDNQTDELSPVLPQTGLPFRVMIEQANFQLPVGFHSGLVGVYRRYWIFIAGRINGLHGFGADPFPPDFQNTNIYVVDPALGIVKSRSLTEPGSGLTQQQIDTLTVTSPQGYQEGDTLYMTGGYGVDTATGTFSTKPYLTAISLPGVFQWVTDPASHRSIASSIRQLYNPIFQITGGRMVKIGNITQLVFGQNFTGVYTTNSNGDYSEQVRRFRIYDSGKRYGGRLNVVILNSLPHSPDSNFRRRDLNIVSVVKSNSGHPVYGLVAYAGVFTPQTGVWTVPVEINSNGNPVMGDPNLPTTFKQAMNQYVCATAGLFSKKTLSMYNIFLGGISYGYFSNGVFQTDSEIPFINQVTTIKMDVNGNYTQYLMDAQYPVILSQRSNPGNQLLFGAGAYFIPNKRLLKYGNGVIYLDRIHGPTVIGYIVGGIQSTLPDTNVDSDSAASPYVFKVTLVPV